MTLGHIKHIPLAFPTDIDQVERKKKKKYGNLFS